MANPAQCYYCFETLAASYDDRDPIALTTIESLWEQYEQSKKLASLGKEAQAADSDEEEDTEEQGPPQSVNDDSPQTNNQPKSLKPPAVGRLQSRTSSDSSSVATTPSSASANSTLSGSTTATTPLGSHSRTADQQYPLFVTWNTLSRSGNKSLRGCIGTFDPKDLAVGLKSFALTSYVFFTYCHPASLIRSRL